MAGGATDGRGAADTGDARDGVIVELSAPAAGGAPGVALGRAIAPLAVLVVVAAIALVSWRGGDARPAPSGAAVSPDPPAPARTTAPDEAAIPDVPPPPVPEVAQPSRLLMELVGHAPRKETVTVRVPPEAEGLTLLAGCSGSGILALTLDGVRIPFDCAEGLLDGTFAAPLSDQTTLTLATADALRYHVSLRSWFAEDPLFRPPVLRLSGGDVSIPGFAGCGTTHTPSDGTERRGPCAPGWMPLPDDHALPVPAGTGLALSLDDAWGITAVDAAITSHAGIVPGRWDPPARAFPGIDPDGRPRVAVPGLPPGEWGLRLALTATRDGESFTATYYFRVAASS